MRRPRPAGLVVSRPSLIDRDGSRPLLNLKVTLVVDDKGKKLIHLAEARRRPMWKSSRFAQVLETLHICRNGCIYARMAVFNNDALARWKTKCLSRMQKKPWIRLPDSNVV
jgi:hypothetical protein